MIKSGDLTNRMETFPEPQGAEVVREELKKMKGKRGPEGEELAERLAAARALEPPSDQPRMCFACYRAGRDAAVKTFEGGGEFADRVRTASALETKHYHSGDHSSFAVGRDAVIALVTGA